MSQPKVESRIGAGIFFSLLIMIIFGTLTYMFWEAKLTIEVWTLMVGLIIGYLLAALERFARL